jgi:hypothetical protein
VIESCIGKQRMAVLGQHYRLDFVNRQDAACPRLRASRFRLAGASPYRGTGVVMREDIASSSFLAVIIVSLIVVCTGLVALGI